MWSDRNDWLFKNTSERPWLRALIQRRDTMAAAASANELPSDDISIPKSSSRFANSQSLPPPKTSDVSRPSNPTPKPGSSLIKLVGTGDGSGRLWRRAVVVRLRRMLWQRLVAGTTWFPEVDEGEDLLSDDQRLISNINVHDRIAQIFKSQIKFCLFTTRSPPHSRGGTGKTLGKTSAGG